MKPKENRGGWQIWVEWRGEKKIVQVLLDKTEAEAEVHRLDWLRSYRIAPAFDGTVTKRRI